MNALARTIARLLTFRLSPEGYANLGQPALVAGLIGTWLVGMGRYWDNPKAEFLQKLGLGSLIYIFVLAALLWLIVLPLRVKDWGYERVLTFVSLTSFPAILYAIPVEMWVGVDRAFSINFFFLLIVTAWRVGLWGDFLHKNTDLSHDTVGAVMFLLLIWIVPRLLLSLLQIDYSIFELMGSFRDQREHDYTIPPPFALILGIIVSFVLLLSISLLIYLGSIWYRWKKRNQP